MSARLFHFSYHKCLTMYVRHVMMRTFVTIGPKGIGSNYEHAASKRERFDALREKKRMVSLNNHYVSPEELGPDFRASRFIRDPRDLLVSGYFYHKRGAEPWCNLVDPTPADWARVNGTIPATLPTGVSYAQYLSDVPLEEGLLAELEFRTAHFDSMLKWPLDDDRILVLTYDQVMGDEIGAFEQMFDHFGVDGVRRQVGQYYARKLSVHGSAGSTAHVRNPRSGQWRDVLPPLVVDMFDERYGELIDKYQFA